MEISMDVGKRKIYVPIDKYTLAVGVEPMGSEGDQFKVILWRKVKGITLGTCISAIPSNYVSCASLAGMNLGLVSEGVLAAEKLHIYIATLRGGVLVLTVPFGKQVERALKTT